MSGQRVLENLVDSRNGKNCGRSGNNGGKTGDRDMAVSDQSVEDVLCCNRRSPLVNNALGLMGYQIPQLCDLMVKHWMDTVHALLRYDSLTAPDLRGVLDNVDIVLRELKGPRLLELIEALMKAAIHVKNMSLKSSSGCWTFVRTKRSGSESNDAAWAVEKILEYVMKEKEDVYSHLSPIARFPVWRLRPSLLKADLSDLANESMRRPLLSLKVESSGCKAFGSMVASLALAPDMLNEVRRLLLTWSSSVRAVRLLELRAQITFAVHSLLQYSNASGCALPNEGIWLHTMHFSSLRPSLQVLIGVPTVSALNHVVELMERQESNAKTAANRAMEGQECERSPKRQRRSYETADQDESLDDSSTNMPGILGEHKETTSGSMKGVYNSPSWAPLADFLRWSTYASQILFQNLNANTDTHQSAADFLGWIMCPSSSEGRAYVVTEILRAAQDWQYMCDEGMSVGNQSFRIPDGTRRFFDLKSNRMDNFSLSLCNLCGCSVQCNGDCVNDGPNRASNSSRLQNLVAWLLRLCSLGRELRLLHLKGCKNVSKHQNFLAGTWRVIRVLPTASLASDSNFLTPQVGSLLLSMILLGLTSGSTEAPTKETSPSSPLSCCTVCEDFHCVSCCHKDRHKSSEPPHRTEYIKEDARIEDDFDWVPFAAALFTHLDTISFPCPAPSQTLPTQISDSKVSVRRVVAACVRHWARVMNQSIVMNSQNVVTLYHGRIQMLEDLHTRVTAWADATGAGIELAEVVGNLELQIEQLRTFL